MKIVRRVGDGMTLLVEHPEHGQHKVAAVGVESPREFKTSRGSWLPESDPRVRVWLLKALADVRAGGKKVEASADPGLRRRTEEEILWLLERNGWSE